MKKNLLVMLFVLALTGMCFAQDVYIVGENVNGAAVVYRNSELLFDYGSANEGIDYHSSDLVMDPDFGDIYWIVNCYDNENYSYGDVFMNDERYFDCPMGKGINMKKLVWCPGYEPSPLLILGTRHGDEDDSRNYVSVWCGNDTDPIFSPGFDSYLQSEAYGMTVIPTKEGFDVAYCGYEAFNEGGGAGATFWVNDTPYEYQLPDEATNSWARDITYYNGELYTCGYYQIGDKLNGIVWQGSSILYDFGEEEESSIFCYIYVDAGDIYVAGFDPTGNHIWKNGEVLYTPDVTPNDVQATSQGVYFVCDGVGLNNTDIYADGELLMNIPDIFFCKFLVDQQCENMEARTLPYSENFDMGETDWDCWSVLFTEGTNYYSDDMYGVAPYWHREIWDGSDAYVAHGYHTDEDLEGALISPLLDFDGDYDSITLSFDHYVRFPEDMKELTVYLYEDDLSEGLVFYDLWTVENPVGAWTTVTIDLTAYKGKEVHLGFSYDGKDGCEWYIDNVEISVSSTPTYTIEVQANDPELGSVQGGGVYSEGEEVTIQAFPIEGVVFKQWNDGNTDNPRTITVTEDATYVATFQRMDVDENGEPVMTVLPNPANDVIRIVGLTENANVEIYNAMGALVKNVNADANTDINVSDLAAGVFFAKVDRRYFKFVIF
ncbi:MAG: T9SS type A sorting domain-containing protein [Bacteroidales bacterium]|nr:T9SS type A sorting domain-containing protein [Bacteroidales bacterium]